LSEVGYHVLSAESAAVAKKFFFRGMQPIDLLLCDAVLPDESGVDLSRLQNFALLRFLDFHFREVIQALGKWAVKPGGMCCTTSIATGRFAGNCGKISCSACGPPVEVPSTTISGTP